MERSYDVLLDEVKQMRARVDSKDSHAAHASPADADKTHDEKIQASSLMLRFVFRFVLFCSSNQQSQAVAIIMSWTERLQSTDYCP